MAAGLMILPFLLLWGRVEVASPWPDASPQD